MYNYTFFAPSHTKTQGRILLYIVKILKEGMSLRNYEVQIPSFNELEGLHLPNETDYDEVMERRPLIPWSGSNGK